MTVEQLINELKKCPKDMIVSCYNEDNDTLLQIRSVERDKENEAPEVTIYVRE